MAHLLKLVCPESVDIPGIFLPLWVMNGISMICGGQTFSAFPIWSWPGSLQRVSAFWLDLSTHGCHLYLALPQLGFVQRLYVSCVFCTVFDLPQAVAEGCGVSSQEIHCEMTGHKNAPTIINKTITCKTITTSHDSKLLYIPHISSLLTSGGSM